MSALLVFNWRDGRCDEVQAPGSAITPRLQHELTHEGAPFTLVDWKIQCRADGGRETVVFYRETVSFYAERWLPAGLVGPLERSPRSCL